jgi:hypothetical protein
MSKQRWMSIVWPAFLMAGLLEVVVFSVVDPQDLHWLSQPLELSRKAIYTLSFFVFWGVTTLSGVLTTLLARSPFEVNHPLVDPKNISQNG